MRFTTTATTVITFLLLGSTLARPTSKLPKGHTGAEIGKLSDGSTGIIAKEGDNIAHTAQHIVDAKKKNPKLDQPLEFTDKAHRTDVLRQHDGGSPVGDGPHTKDEFPTSKTTIPGLSDAERNKITSVQKLPSKEQGGVKADQADPDKGRKNQGVQIGDAHRLADKVEEELGFKPKLEHQDNRSGS